MWGVYASSPGRKSDREGRLLRAAAQVSSTNPIREGRRGARGRACGTRTPVDCGVRWCSARGGSCPGQLQAEARQHLSTISSGVTSRGQLVGRPMWKRGVSSLPAFAACRCVLGSYRGGQGAPVAQFLVDPAGGATGSSRVARGRDVRGFVEPSARDRRRGCSTRPSRCPQRTAPRRVCNSVRCPAPGPCPRKT